MTTDYAMINKALNHDSVKDINQEIAKNALPMEINDSQGFNNSQSHNKSF